MDRRNFLKSATSIALIGAVDNISAQSFYSESDNYLNNNIKSPLGYIENNILPDGFNQDFWDKPREIYLKRSATQEQYKIIYHKNGLIDYQGYLNACYMLRDVRVNQTVYMDIKLLDLICAIQAWLKFNGIFGPLIITSGFRNKKTNGITEGSAKNSMHIKGQALDFYVEGIHPILLGKLASKFLAGGVGIYISKKFNHVDTGGIRYWYKR